MEWNLCSSPLCIPFYPYTMFQNPMPKPSCQKPRKNIMTQKVLVTQSSNIVHCNQHTQKPICADFQAASWCANMSSHSSNVKLPFLTTRCLWGVWLTVLHLQKVCLTVICLFNCGIENSIGNESGSLKVVPWCSNTVHCLWRDMCELV